MIQLNLLPDIKLEYIKAQRLKRLVMVASALSSGVALGIFILLLLFVDVAQKKHLSDINRDINRNSSQLSRNPDLNKILTIQNQIQSLPALQTQTPAVSRIFSFMTQIMPVNASISTLNADFTLHTLSLSGSADNLATVNKLVDTIKFTTYKDSNSGNPKAFTSVVLSSFGYSKNNSNGKPALFTVNFNFDPNIFDNTMNLSTLNVPQETTTRSIIGQPTDLFQAADLPPSSPTSNSNTTKK